MTPKPQSRVRGCWRSIGRPGPGTCPELTHNILCRNCGHYATAALALLEREVPGDYTREWTEHLAVPADSGSVKTTSALVFRLGSEWLGLPSTAVDKVLECAALHRLPHRALPVRGLVAVRGELVVCVALHALLGIDAADVAPASARAYARLVIMNGADGCVAFEPDEIGGVHRYGVADLIAAPITLTKSSAAPYTIGLFTWNNHTVGALDGERLLSAIGRSLS